MTDNNNMGKTKNSASEQPTPRDKGQRIWTPGSSFSSLRQFKQQKKKLVVIDLEQLNADIGDSCRWIVVQAVANGRESDEGRLWSEMYTDIFRPLSTSQAQEVRIMVDPQRLQEMIDTLEQLSQELAKQQAESYPLVQALQQDLTALAAQIGEPEGQ